MFFCRFNGFLNNSQPNSTNFQENGQITYCQKTYCPIAVCQITFCQKAVCQKTFCLLTDTPIFSPHRVFFSLNFCSYLNHSCSWVQNNQLLWRCIKSSQHLNYINFPHRNCFFTAKTFFEWVFGWQYYNAHR